MPAPDSESATAPLPNLAYFASGRGPVSKTLVDALRAAGFNNINGVADLRKALQLWIAPVGEQKQEISPPGTAPRQLYDTSSLITIVVAHSQLPVEATFMTAGQYNAQQIRDALALKGFKNVFGAAAKDKVAAVWVSPPEFQTAPRPPKPIILYDTSSLIVLVATSRDVGRKGQKRPKARKPEKAGKPQKARAAAAGRKPAKRLRKK